jgi:mannitol/fructose-specific phosphotransferase system IIA component (Ntr-type)
VHADAAFGRTTSVAPSFRDILRLASVEATLASATKDQVLLELSRLVGRAASAVPVDTIRDVLRDREHLASTGVGSGVAIPHGRIRGLDATYVALGRHRRGIHFDAVDGLPVQLFVTILTPDDDPSAHLRWLARASRLLRHEAARAALLACDDSAALLEAFLGLDQEA